MSNVYEIFMPIKDYEDTVYKSAHDAAKQLNLHSGSITKCCKGKRKSTGGYQFKYYTEGDLL